MNERMAKCGCGNTAPSIDRWKLFAFESTAEGSRNAVETCKHCRIHLVAHTVEGMSHNVLSNRATVIQRGICAGFEPIGEMEFDRYYCGCRGWD